MSYVIANHPQSLLTLPLVPPQEVFPFLFRARFFGTMHWDCPKCGHLQRHQLRPETFLVQCRAGEGCRRVYGVSPANLYTLERGRKSLPPDMIMPRRIDPLPEGLVGVWRQGEYIHRIA